MRVADDWAKEWPHSAELAARIDAALRESASSDDGGMGADAEIGTLIATLDQALGTLAAALRVQWKAPAPLDPRPALPLHRDD